MLADPVPLQLGAVTSSPGDLQLSARVKGGKGGKGGSKDDDSISSPLSVRQFTSQDPHTADTGLTVQIPTDGENSPAHALKTDWKPTTQEEFEFHRLWLVIDGDNDGALTREQSKALLNRWHQSKCFDERGSTASQVKKLIPHMVAELASYASPESRDAGVVLEENWGKWFRGLPKEWQCRLKRRLLLDEKWHLIDIEGTGKLAPWQTRAVLVQMGWFETRSTYETKHGVMLKNEQVSPACSMPSTVSALPLLQRSNTAVLRGGVPAGGGGALQSVVE